MFGESERLTYAQWEARLMDPAAPLTLEELRAVLEWKTGGTVALVVKHQEQILASLQRLEEYLVVTTGAEYPRPNDQRAPNVIARRLLATLDAEHQETLAAAVRALDEGRAQAGPF